MGKEGGKIFAVRSSQVSFVEKSGSCDHAIDSQFAGSSYQVKEASRLRAFVFGEGNNLVEKRSNSFSLGGGDGSAKKLVPADC
jgi:hypothetical protein